MMNLIRSTAIAAICALGASYTLQASAGSDFDSARAAAVASLDAAKASGNEWRDSRKILAKAEAAFKQGDLKTAMKLVEQAKRQGELAVAQAKAQQHAAANN